MHNDSVRRIMAELKELSRLNAQPHRLFYATPLESDLFEWHFSVRGPPDTAFEGGIYHGRIVLPTDYPLKPPEIIMLTPNGRFEVGKRICLSVTAHHQETWQPSWGIRTILTALIGFMPSPAEGLGSLDYPDEDRRRLAIKSHSFICDRCGARPIEQLPPLIGTSGISEGNVLGTASSPNTQALSSTAGPSSATGSASAASSSTLTSPTDEPSSNSASNDSSTSASPTGTSQIPNGEGAATSTDINPQQSTSSANGTVAGPSSSARRVRERSPRREEKELLYAAYAIVALMIAVIARRVVKTMTE
ncbi:Ubiquitin-conjugating enzyme [Gracilaria domingensis]|nr:Ubiquitin-conjugating enzyme [Gracilaria domingensis]